MRCRENDFLGRTRCVLGDDVHEVPEVPRQLPRAHRGSDFERTPKGDRDHVKPFLFKEPFIDGRLKDNGVGSGEHPDPECFGVKGRCEAQGERRGRQSEGSHG